MWTLVNKVMDFWLHKGRETLYYLHDKYYSIRPVVSCGAEVWTLTKKEEQALLIFERKIFRRIYGPKYENGEWKSRTNRELDEMSKGENIVKWIKGQTIRWSGHLERMEEDRMLKKIFTQELEGTRRRGRARKRWKEEA